MRPLAVRRLLLTVWLVLAAAGTAAQAPGTAAEPGEDAGTEAGVDGGGDAAAWEATLDGTLAARFSDDAAWDEELQAVADLVPTLAELRGTLGQDAASLRLALDRLSTVGQRLQRLRAHARRQFDAEPGNRRHQARNGLLGSLEGRIASALAWVDPELQAIGADRLAAFQAAEPGLAPHAVRLRDALRRAPHTLAPEVEAALAAVQPVLDGAARAQTLLLRSDLAWPVLLVDGQAVTVDAAGFDRLRRHPDRMVRRRAFDSFWGSHRRVENTLGALLAQRVQRNVVSAQLRQYPSAAAAALAAADLPEPVLRTLVAEVNQALPALHRYFRLRQRLLKLPELHDHDLDVDLVPARQAVPAETAAATLLAAVRPLGDDYQAALQQTLRARPPTMARADGGRRLACASGRSMHRLLAQQHQLPALAGVPPALAAVAPATHALLLAEQRRRAAASRDDRIAALVRLLEQLRDGYFRPTLDTEFALAVHAAQQRGEPLSGARFTEVYCGLLRKYHGADLGVVAVDPAGCIAWAARPPAERPFDGHATAIGAVAAQFFADRLLAGRPGARDAYLQLLQAGTSVPTPALLLRAGIDLASPAPYQALLQAMDRAVDELDRLLR